MPNFHHIIARLPSEKELWRGAITTAVNDLLHELLKHGVRIEHGTMRIRTYFNPSYLRDEVLITWDQSE